MNIAISALIIFILLLPGAVSITAYYTSLREKSSSDLHRSFTDKLLLGLITSLVLHCCAICCIRLSGYQVDFHFLYDVLIANKIFIEGQQFTKYVLDFCFYSIVLILFSFIATKFFKRWVISNNYDIKFNNLKTANYWFLVFSGRYLDKRKQGAREETDLIYVDVLASRDIIYSGFLFDFNYSADKGRLENLILKTTAKRTYIKGNGKEHKLKLAKRSFINGDAFLIPANEIVNINIYYISLEGEVYSNKAFLPTGS